MAGPSVENVFPSDTQTGVVLGSEIHVVFDVEVDSTTIPGNIMVEGPDTDRWTGPDLGLWDRPDTETTENILDSPGFKGIVQGAFTYELLDTNDDVVSGPDYDGTNNWKHRVIFTPTNILAPSTEYTVYISGDEDDTDSFINGISSRTVYAAEAGANTGQGELHPVGGYTGAVSDIYNFEITTSGTFGVATYEWYKDSDALTVRTGYVSEQTSLLLDGVSIYWSGTEATPFVIGDTFTVVVEPAEYMEDIFTFVFTTGSGSITAVPPTTSTSPLGTIGLPPVTALEVLSVVPDIRETNVDLSTKVIAITFNKDIDPTTATDCNIIIQSLPVNGDPSIPSLGNIFKILYVSGPIVYCILQSGGDPLV